MLFKWCSIENQKGINAVQWCSIENQKGINAVQWCSGGNQKGTIALVLDVIYLYSNNTLVVLKGTMTE